MKFWRFLKAILFGSRGDNALAASGSSSTDATTEFAAEVVRVTEVLPHPNADRLEIAHFEMATTGPSAYDVVIQKGTYKPGDLAAYFSVDCLLPTTHPAFAFLLDRLDGAGKAVYRLKAARLRGTFSQGLLVTAPDTHAFGDRVDQTFGVTYHVDPEPEERNPTAPTRKPKIQPMPVYGVESLKKVPRLFDAGELVMVTEKIHGCNFRFGWVRRKFLGFNWGWRFVVGSHRMIKDGGGPGYYGVDLWTRAVTDMRLRDMTRDLKGHVFYGELYGYTTTGQPIQDLTYGTHPAKGPRLAIFDIWDAHNKTWVRALDRYRMCLSLELPHVPVLYLSTLWEPGLLGLAEGNTTLCDSHIREGIVIETLNGPRKKAKFVGQGYLLRKPKEAPKPTAKPKMTDAEFASEIAKASPDANHQYRMAA